MPAERDRAPQPSAAAPAEAGGPGADRSRTSGVQHAVERFVELHSCGRAPDAAAFAADYPADLRAAILAQCREFLAFDGLLGHQEWESQPRDGDAVGRPFGDFLIQEELGRGGMGVVYLAHQQSLNRRVALKVMQSGLTLSKRHVERFRREAEAAARVRHPAIVAVHSLTEVDGTFALAMDYVAGRNLADMLDDLRLAKDTHGGGAIDGTLGLAPEKGYVAECAMFAAQIASALAAAHQNGVVHRDLKPRNLMLDDRRQARLLDFGLAKSLDAAHDGRSISMSGEITGTAHYMSPEQTLAKRVDVDHRADIWALGVILYELLTLERPFDGRNLQQIVYQICFQEPVPIQRKNPKVPRDLVTIVLKALEKDPQKRYESAAELEADLQRFLRWEPIHARPASAWSRLAKFARRHRTEATIAAAALAVTASVVGALGYRSHVDGQRAAQLMATAEQRAHDGDYAAAIALANQALELHNDAVARGRLEVFHAENKNTETEAAWKVAQSRQLLEHDREAALLLALDAEAQLSSPDTRSAVLDALGSGWAARTLPTPPRQKLMVATWSPNGRRIAVGGYGGLVQVFAAERDDGPLALAGHDAASPVVGAAFAGDDLLVTASPDGTLRLWPLGGDGGAPAELALPGPVASMHADATGAHVLVVTSASQTGPYAAQVWDTARRAPAGPAIVHADYTAAALSPSGRFAATCSGLASVVRLSRVADGATLAEFAHHAATGDVKQLAFAPDDSLCAVATNDGSVRLYGVPDGALRCTVRHPEAVTSIAFDRAGERLLTGSRDRTARLWQLARNASGDVDAREIGVLVGHAGPVLHVAFDRSDQLAVTATGSPDEVLRVFDVGRGRTPGGEAIRRYEVGAAIDDVAFDPEQQRVLAIAGGRALVWDFGTARGVVTVRQPGAVPAACFVGDGQRLVTAGDDERLRLWATRDGRQLWTTERLGNPVLTVDVDRTGDRVACGMVGGAVRVHRVRDGGLLYSLAGHAGNVPAVRFFADDSRLLTAGGAPTGPGGAAIVWNSNDWSPLQQIDTPLPIVAADVGPDGALLVTVEKDQRVVRLWALPDGNARGDIGDHERAIRHVCFAPSGDLVLTASDDGTARLYTLTGERRAIFATPARVNHVAFAPDGSQLLTCGVGRNAPAQLWRTADGIERLHFDGHRGTVEWAAFSADGAWAATAARDGTTCIWPTDPVAVARRLPLRTSPPVGPRPDAQHR